MAGSPTCGKISTGMRRTARMAHRAMAINATTTVSGLRSAARTRRMLLPQVCQDALWGRPSACGGLSGRLAGVDAGRRTGILPHTACSLPDLRHEGPDVAGCRSHRPQPAPHAQPGERVVDFGLREQPLGFRHFVDVAEPRFVAGRGLIGGRTRGRYLDGRIGCDPAGALHGGDRYIPLRAEIGGDLLRSGGLRTDRSRLRGFPRLYGGQIRDGKADREAQGIILYAWREAVQATEQSAVGFRAAAARVCRALQIEPRKV